MEPRQPRQPRQPSAPGAPALTVGQIVSGRVSSVVPYGAFIALTNAPGITSGLVHISQISALRVAQVSDVLAVGMEVKCSVLTIDERGRPELATRTLEKVPGQMLFDAGSCFLNAEANFAANKANAARERLVREVEAEAIVFGLAELTTLDLGDALKGRKRNTV